MIIELLRSDSNTCHTSYEADAPPTKCNGGTVRALRGPLYFKVPTHVMGSSPAACLDSCIHMYILGSGEHIQVTRHFDAVMVHIWS